MVCRYVRTILPGSKRFRSYLYKSRMCFYSTVCFFYFMELVYSFLLSLGEELGSVIHFIVFVRAEGK